MHMNKENGKAFVLGFESGEAAEQERIVRLLEVQDSVSGAWAIALIRGEKMTDQDRFENIENVRDMYRDQGAERERERIIRALEDEIERVSNPMLVDREYLDGLEVAIELIKGKQNPHVRAETRASTTLNTTNIGNSACSCGCKGDKSE
jgi:hypothetical protein